MRNRTRPREVVLPRTKLFTDDAGWVIVLECFCGAAVQYPGHVNDAELSRCETCGTQWRVIDSNDLVRILGG
jgi:hypothetical protein